MCIKIVSVCQGVKWYDRIVTCVLNLEDLILNNFDKYKK
jgi:hypothetical protein